MSQLEKNTELTFEVARRIRDHEVDAGPDGERLLQIVDEVKRLRIDNQGRAADQSAETAYSVALRIAKKLEMKDLL
jgi:hypothetical protein